MFPYIIMRALDMLQRGFSTKNCRKRERWEAAPHWHLQPEVFCWEVLPQVGLLLEAAPMPFRGVLPIFCRSSMQIQAVLELRRLSVNSFEVTCRVSALPLTQRKKRACSTHIPSRCHRCNNRDILNKWELYAHLAQQDMRRECEGFRSKLSKVRKCHKLHWQRTVVQSSIWSQCWRQFSVKSELLFWSHLSPFCSRAPDLSKGPMLCTMSTSIRWNKTGPQVLSTADCSTPLPKAMINFPVGFTTTHTTSDFESFTDCNIILKILWGDNTAPSLSMENWTPQSVILPKSSSLMSVYFALHLD